MESLNFSTISTINSELPQNNYVDESVASTIANISCMDVAATKTTGNDKSYKYEKKRKKKKNEGTIFIKMQFTFIRGAARSFRSIESQRSENGWALFRWLQCKLIRWFFRAINNHSFSFNRSRELFLQIYLAGFTTSQRDKLNRILNVGSATRLNDISDALTHVIIGDESKASNELKSMKSAGLWYLTSFFSLIFYYVLIKRLPIKTVALARSINILQERSTLFLARIC